MATDACGAEGIVATCPAFATGPIAIVFPSLHSPGACPTADKQTSASQDRRVSPVKTCACVLGVIAVCANTTSANANHMLLGVCRDKEIFNQLMFLLIPEALCSLLDCLCQGRYAAYPYTQGDDGGRSRSLRVSARSPEAFRTRSGCMLTPSAEEMAWSRSVAKADRLQHASDRAHLRSSFSQPLRDQPRQALWQVHA